MSEPLLPLLHLCDSLFPLGSFAHSDGLESAVHAGLVRTGEDLDDWLTACLDEVVGRCDGPAVADVWSAFHAADWERIADVDRDLVAMRPAAAARASTRAMGRRLMATWQAVHAGSEGTNPLSCVDCGSLGPSLPVAFGAVSASAGVAQRSAVEGYAYTRLAASVSAAMRLIPIGQIEAHTRLAAACLRIPATVDDLLHRASPSETFTPMLDIMAMTHRSVHSRLFRS
ncbi:MAG TPA: urease accessory UreF family protein [Vicinamibacterales bacterium]|jgi:urease accessory protein|nr:urease accessory UreF family protein [Vicinamibacterales bacterium]